MAKGFDKDIANIHAANAAELKNRLKTGLFPVLTSSMAMKST